MITDFVQAYDAGNIRSATNIALGHNDLCK